MAGESTSGTRVWVVAESSAGFGRARAALERGELVVATARKPEQHEDFDDLSTTNQPPQGQRRPRHDRRLYRPPR